MANGDLLRAAEEAGFDVLLTTDKNMRYQQNFAGRRIAVVVLGNGLWPFVKPMLPQVAAEVNTARPGQLYGSRDSKPIEFAIRAVYSRFFFPPTRCSGSLGQRECCTRDLPESN